MIYIYIYIYNILLVFEHRLHADNTLAVISVRGRCYMLFYNLFIGLPMMSFTFTLF